LVKINPTDSPPHENVRRQKVSSLKKFSSSLALDLAINIKTDSKVRNSMMANTADELSDSYYSKNLLRISSQHLDLPPSCVEFLPNDTTSSAISTVNFNEYFVVGTYHLQSAEATEPVAGSDSEDEAPNPPIKPQERDGSLNIFRIQGEQL
jgi:hypothetical protein